jgi:hypothetical protein
MRIVALHMLLKSNHICEAQVECHRKLLSDLQRLLGFSVRIARTCTEEDNPVLNFDQIFISEVI